jgi:hypothetical protein
LETTTKILKKTLYNDSFFRFVRKKECFELIEKFKDKKEIVYDIMEIKYPYTEKDYQNRIITEKDIMFLDHLSEDSFDWELVKSNKKYNINTFIMHNIEKILPNLNSKNLTFLKANIILPFSFIQSAFILANLKVSFPIIIKTENIKYMDFDELKDEYEKLSDEVKLTKGEKISQKRENCNIDAYIQISKFMPIFKSYWASSIINHKNEIRIYTKYCFSKPDMTMEEYQKTKMDYETEKFISNNKEQINKYRKTELSFYFIKYEMLESKKCNFTITLLNEGVTSNKYLSKLMTKITLKSIYNNLISISKQNFDFPKDLDFSNISKFDENNYFYKMIENLNIKL